MQNAETLSLYSLFQKFPDEDSARLYFESRRWINGRYCPHCGSVDTVECKDHKPMPYRCKDCRKHFSVRTDSVLEESRLPLQKWLMAMYMMTTARKGIPSTQMAKELGITQKSAWFLAQRIREGFLSSRKGAPSDDGGMLSGIVEADETYVGGKEMNKHANKKLNAGRGTIGKSIVMGLRTRAGMVDAFVISDTKGRTIKEAVRARVAPGSVLCTDEHSSYAGMPEYTHLVVNHSAKQYVDQMAHTNGIESFWALLKRGHYGVFHYMSVKHLHRYVNEFAFRHNTADQGTLQFINQTITNMSQRRLTYKELTHG